MSDRQISREVPVERVAAVCEFLVRCGVSDHYGEGVTAARVAEDLPLAVSSTQSKLFKAVEAGYLEDRPAVKLDGSGTPKAYQPA
jgi:hypothetical protein